MVGHRDVRCSLRLVYKEKNVAEKRLNPRQRRRKNRVSPAKANKKTKKHGKDLRFGLHLSMKMATEGAYIFTEESMARGFFTHFRAHIHKDKRMKKEGSAHGAFRVERVDRRRVKKGRHRPPSGRTEKN
ncbi:hypothetical protein GTNG_1457 [Geobacillus thermodenitrificans NG80-2]|uniref:Uncharacterized protein n=1 Tax=Geobacillus thermodenitrificans (strain NG80-2) TaxID=420246 RepID=A4INC3_GEOTN|nr:hypothetical protein GTNG_1457 [Geobacillus thermodenitrificans NG80-2]